MKNKKGMTLVEVVVAMGLFGIIMVTIFPAFLITNLVNITAQQRMNANYLAQVEIEELYNISISTPFEDVISEEADSWIAAERGFDCDVSWNVCTKSEDGFDFELTFEDHPDISTLKIITLIVSTPSGENPGNRAQIEVHLRFSEPAESLFRLGNHHNA